MDSLKKKKKERLKRLPFGEAMVEGKPVIMVSWTSRSWAELGLLSRKDHEAAEAAIEKKIP